MAKILFISDIHYSVNDKKGVYTDDSTIKFPHLIGTRGLRVLREAIKNIAPIDLVVFCGDVINGYDSDEEKKEAIKEIRELADNMAEDYTIFGENVNPKERIIFILGNHDMDRKSGEHHPAIARLIDSYLSSESSKSATQPMAPIFVFADLKIVLAAIPTEKNNNVKNESIQKALQIIDTITEETDKKNELIDLLTPYGTYDIPSIDTKET